MRKAFPRRLLALSIAIALLGAACGGEAVRFQPSPTPEVVASSAAPTLSPSAPPTPMATPDPAASCTNCWPLNGKPLAAGAAVDRRPLVIKIDNVPAARPHYGITQADLVIE